MNGHRVIELLAAASLATLSWACGGAHPTPPTAPSGSPQPAASAPAPAPAPAPDPVAAGPTGSYLLTLTASPICDAVKDTYSGQILALPEEVRVRHYTAEFNNGTAILTAADGTGNKVPLGGIDHYAYPDMPLMTMTGDELTIVVPPGNGGGYIVSSPTCAGGDYWWEVFDSTPGRNQVFESCGTWKGTIEDSGRIEGTIYGTFGYYVGNGPHWTTDLFCRAADHHFTLVKSTDAAATGLRRR